MKKVVMVKSRSQKKAKEVEEMSVTKAQEGKIEDQVKMQRMSSPCERRFFFPINLEFMRSGKGREQWFEGRR